MPTNEHETCVFDCMRECRNERKQTLSTKIASNCLVALLCEYILFLCSLFLFSLPFFSRCFSIFSFGIQLNLYVVLSRALFVFVFNSVEIFHFFIRFFFSRSLSFLQVSQWYDLVVFTASMEIYGAAVADKLDNGRNILRRRYYRQHCTPDFGSYTKDLTAICNDLNRVNMTHKSINPSIFDRFHQQSSMNLFDIFLCRYLLQTIHPVHIDVFQIMQYQ